MTSKLNTIIVCCHYLLYQLLIIEVVVLLFFIMCILIDPLSSKEIDPCSFWTVTNTALIPFLSFRVRVFFLLMSNFLFEFGIFWTIYILVLFCTYIYSDDWYVQYCPLQLPPVSKWCLYHFLPFHFSDFLYSSDSLGYL